MAKYKVVITDYDFPDAETERKILSEISAELILSQCRTENEVIRVAKDADALLNQYAPISAKVLGFLRNCKVIVAYGIGVDTIDVSAATKKGIIIANVPSYCEEEVSNHALALILNCTRKIFTFGKKSKNWDWKVGRPIYKLSEQVLGLVGFGKISKLVVRKAQIFGFRVIAFDPYLPDEHFKRYNVERVNFEELLKRSDVISIHLPLTKGTRYMFDTHEFKKMRNSAYLVNTSRGAIVNEKALYDAILDKEIAGAGLDVLEQEPPEPNSPLFGLDNVVITPHAAWYSEESLVELQTKAVQEVVRVLKGKRPHNLVNKKLQGKLNLK